MRGKPGRLGFVALCTLLGAVGAFAVGAGQAGSLQAVSGYFTMVSEPGESVGQGQSYSYVRPDDFIELGISPYKRITAIARHPTDIADFTVHLSAPGRARLEPGTYENVAQEPDATHAELDVFGHGRGGCEGQIGSFTVHSVEYGPHDYLKSIHASYEQLCYPWTGWLRGEFNLVGPPPPPPLVLGLTVDSTAGYDRRSANTQLHGKLACSQRVQAGMNGEATQTTASGTAHAWLWFFTTDCTKSTPWKIKVVSDTATPFVEGPIHVTLTASATDEWYTTYNENELIQATDSENPIVTAGPGG